MTEIKICGLFRECDIEAVNDAKVDYAGFIIDFEKSHRNLSIKDATHLRSLLDKEIKAVGVFVNKPSEEVVQAAHEIRLDVIQLHGNEDEDYIRKVKELSGLTVWKAFKIRSAEDVKVAVKSPADTILLDNGYGTGEVFDWSVVTKIEREFILAGGLNEENVALAIKTLDPAVVDISSGAETDRLKDSEKIKACVKAVRK
ncbi:MAG: phosphoribosylanthranilate isomerase [Lachnospiraceae bacterium]|nr:phosphoribosylanthranilate isomerase [Lachnospiraceae bacterium]